MSESANVDITELLSQLRDIQEPVAPQGTSLVLIAFCIVLSFILIIVFLYQRNRARYAFRHEAFYRIDTIANRTNESSNQSIFELATLLRQIMRHRVGNCINKLDDIAWLKALDTEFSSAWFTTGRGQIFGSTLYKNTELPNHEIRAVCEELKSEIRRLKPIGSTN